MREKTSALEVEWEICSEWTLWINRLCWKMMCLSIVKGYVQLLRLFYENSIFKSHTNPELRWEFQLHFFKKILSWNYLWKFDITSHISTEVRHMISNFEKKWEKNKIYIAILVHFLPLSCKICIFVKILQEMCPFSTR